MSSTRILSSDTDFSSEPLSSSVIHTWYCLRFVSSSTAWNRSTLLHRTPGSSRRTCTSPRTITTVSSAHSSAVSSYNLGKTVTLIEPYISSSCTTHIVSPFLVVMRRASLIVPPNTTLCLSSSSVISAVVCVTRSLKRSLIYDRGCFEM